MSPLSAPVLGGAAVIASPALWASLVDGTLPLDVALTRYLVAVLACWVGLSLLLDFALPDRAELARAVSEGAEGVPSDAAPGSFPDETVPDLGTVSTEAS